MVRYLGSGILLIDTARAVNLVKVLAEPSWYGCPCYSFVMFAVWVAVLTNGFGVLLE